MCNLNITTKRLTLRDFGLNDYDFYRKLESNPFTIKYETDDLPSEKLLKENFDNILDLKKNNMRSKYSLLVEDNSTKKSLGRVVIWQISEDINEWEIGWYFLPEFTNMGYATEAAFAMKKFAFNDLKVHRLQALCNASNIPSEKVMINIGMKKEGTLRAIRKLNNQWVDMHIYSLIDSDN